MAILLEDNRNVRHSQQHRHASYSDRGRLRCKSFCCLAIVVVMMVVAAVVAVIAGDAVCLFWP